MKRIYIKPEVIVVNTYMESLLLGDSQGQVEDNYAKKHDFGFSSWDDEEDEEEQPDYPKSKSLWDD